MSTVLKNKDTQYNFIIMGAGLSGCLLFSFLSRRFTDSKILLLEEQAEIAGHHTWSLHLSDVPPTLRQETEHLLTHIWPEYDVYFPEYHRHLKSSYGSLRSEDLREKILKLQNAKHHILTSTPVIAATTKDVQTDQHKYSADYVIDCRGWPELTGKLGYQKFVGLELELEQEHQLKGPIIKDVRVPQTDGYRFVYVLPFSKTSVLIEDTYYSDSPELDEGTIEQEIKNYCYKYFGSIKNIKHKEVGALPLILEKQNWQQTTLALGAKTSYYQPVTGYSFPQTLATLEFLLDQFTKKNSQEEITAALSEFLTQKRADSEFLLTLNRMLFLAAKPHRRYIILQRFYKLPESLIHNFYRGQLTLWEKSRILIGKPPVSPISALKAIFFKSAKASSLAQSSK